MNSCPMLESTDLVGKKWTLVLLEEVSLHGGAGFNDLFRRMHKITPKLLSQRLKELERCGLLQKQVRVRKKVRHSSYGVTEKGAALYKIMLQLKKWNSTFTPGHASCESRECVNCPYY